MHYQQENTYSKLTTKAVHKEITQRAEKCLATSFRAVFWGFDTLSNNFYICMFS